MTRTCHQFLVLVAATLVAIAASASPALAQDRTTRGRARMELSFDHGFALGVTSVRENSDTTWTTLGVAGTADLRLYAPSGFGAVVRTGYEGVFSSGLFSLDIGAAYRGDLLSGTHGGIQLVATAGASVSYGTLIGVASYQGWFPGLVSSEPVALGGVWGSVHVDFWHRNSFFGLGLTARAQWADGYDDSLVSLVPTIRVGGDWGL